LFPFCPNHSIMVKQTTLCIIKKEHQILLGMKKTGFGIGKYCGFGGKVEAGESYRVAAVRELQEESGLMTSPADLLAQGSIRYYFPAQPAWDLQLHLFTAGSWQGTPHESAEMRPCWFGLDQIPYSQMWDDARYWFPVILEGKYIEAEITYDATNERVSSKQILVRDI